MNYKYGEGKCDFIPIDVNNFKQFEGIIFDTFRLRLANLSYFKHNFYKMFNELKNIIIQRKHWYIPHPRGLAHVLHFLSYIPKTFITFPVFKNGISKCRIINKFSLFNLLLPVTSFLMSLCLKVLPNSYSLKYNYNVICIMALFASFTVVAIGLSGIFEAQLFFGILRI